MWHIRDRERSHWSFCVRAPLDATGMIHQGLGRYYLTTGSDWAWEQCSLLLSVMKCWISSRQSGTEGYRGNNTVTVRGDRSAFFIISHQSVNLVTCKAKKKGYRVKQDYRVVSKVTTLTGSCQLLNIVPWILLLGSICSLIFLYNGHFAGRILYSDTAVVVAHWQNVVVVGWGGGSTV